MNASIHGKLCHVKNNLVSMNRLPWECKSSKEKYNLGINEINNNALMKRVKVQARYYTFHTSFVALENSVEIVFPIE